MAASIRGSTAPRARDREHGQATIAGIGIALAAIALAVIVIEVGRAYLAQARLQTAADIAAAVMASPSAQAGDSGGLGRAGDVARANGAERVATRTDGQGRTWLVVHADAPRGVTLPRSTMTAEALVEWGVPASATVAGGSHGAYSGPLVPIDAARACPAVAASYRAMQHAAAVDGIAMWAVSGYRTVAEQAALFASLGPGIAAPPGASLHHQATELDLSVGAAGSSTHRWLTMHAGTFGFVQRYSWEPWHWGNIGGC